MVRTMATVTGLLNTLATTDALAEVFSDANLLAGMLRFEVALARAEARRDIIPGRAATDITAAAASAVFPVDAIAREARQSGTVAIPVIERLRGCVRLIDPESAAYVHWAATSQDVTDTALVLCLARALPILAADQAALSRALRQLSDVHAETVMLARTLMQPAPPITFGLKVASWCAASERSWAALARGFDEGLLVQCGGSSGTLGALGTEGPAVAAGVAHELGLGVPDAPWHTQRDRLAAIVLGCGRYTAALAKIARDVTLLMQGEVAEVSERGGGSSSMPHKRNPAGSATVLAAAARVPGLVASYLTASVHEHERGVGGLHAEAPIVAGVVQAAGAALDAMRQVIEGLEVSPERMRANLAATGGAVYAERALLRLSRSLGRPAAEAAVSRALHASAHGTATFVAALTEILGVTTAVPGEALADLDSPDAYLAAADSMRRRLLGRQDP